MFTRLRNWFRRMRPSPQREVELFEDIPKLARFREYASVTSWQELLNTYSSASPADKANKWRMFVYLKSVGVDVLIDDIQLDYKVYFATARVVNILEITATANGASTARLRALRALVSFIGELRQLVKRTNKYVLCDGLPEVTVLEKLALHHPQLVRISSAGCCEEGYSTTVEIVQVVECTEADVELNGAKQKAALKVVRYLLQISGMLMEEETKNEPSSSSSGAMPVIESITIGPSQRPPANSEDIISMRSIITDSTVHYGKVDDETSTGRLAQKLNLDLVSMFIEEEKEEEEEDDLGKE